MFFLRGRSGIRVGLCAKIEWTISFDWQAGAATTVGMLKMLELLARCGCCCDSFATVCYSRGNHVILMRETQSRV